MKSRQDGPRRPWGVGRGGLWGGSRLPLPGPSLRPQHQTMPRFVPPPIRLARPGAQRRRDPGITVAMVVGASAVVAAAAAGVGLLVPPIALGSGWVRGLRYVGLAVVLVGLGGLLFDRPAQRPTRGPDPTLAAIFAAAALMSLLALAALLAPRTPFDMGGSRASASSRAGMGPEGAAEAEEIPPPPPPTATADLTEGFRPDGIELGGPSASDVSNSAEEEEGSLFDWGALSEMGDVLLAALIVGLLIAGRWVMKRRPDGEPRRDPEPEPVTAEDAAVLLGTSLEALLSPGLPSREAITAAYRRLLEVLAAVGAGRQPYEAPHEHLARTVVPLGVSPGPMARLAELYVLAQFSEAPIEEAHRADAATALRSSLAELRARAGGSA